MELVEKENTVLALQELSLGDITVQDKYLINAQRLELNYLSLLDVDRLLVGFMETRGLVTKKKRYGGWESTEIQGHTLGHYLTAVSQAYGVTGQKDLLVRIQYIVSQLQKCQAVDGYLFAWEREIFDRVENLQPAWVPWYTMHKILSGLLTAYKMTGLQDAYTVMRNLGIWIYNRSIAWSPQRKATVLAVEYGGMNDALYELYQVTGDERFAAAAHQFDELTLFEPIYNNVDVLKGLHANTTIPKILGALKRYVILGSSEQYYLEVAKNFWDMVINHHSYITGGNSEWEHFGEPYNLDEERTACNCETCNTYNMLKLSKLLFQVTKEKKYADYYEQAFINAILSSQNPKDGMTTYFQPMATGYFKVYSTPYNSFWCCTGSGMENFTKLTEGTFFYDKQTFYINRFYDADVNWNSKNVALQIKADFLESEQVQVKIKQVTGDRDEFCIAIRIPEWVKEQVLFFINGERIQYTMSNGYAHMERAWRSGDKITTQFPMKLSLHSIPDNDNVVAFTYGPFVLSAGLGTQMMDTTYTGVDVLVPTKEIVIRDYIIIQKEEIETWKKQFNQYLVKTRGKLEFILKISNDGIPLTFKPHFLKQEERYGIYFRLYKKDSADYKVHSEKLNKKQQLQKLQIDVIPVGNDQYELAHGIKGVKTDTEMKHGLKCRYCKDEDGWFSYQLHLEVGTQLLCATYCSEDEGNEFDIFLNDTLLAHEKVIRDDTMSFYTKAYYIPGELIGGNNTVTVKFHNSNPHSTCCIYDELYIRKQ